ncbi:hypothetical protein RHSIM_Rhsim12G0094600 [Rhododendron simsii]|uniref:Uncharacterized protein n=1 Tax=Rhododendron simsii TaxID=118357 RepID=A0A834G6L0_RHOSS|nr:hypothetical protein RHSIM_Rhsim12G0094600 [Rhododendron simsii]
MSGHHVHCRGERRQAGSTLTYPTTPRTLIPSASATSPTTPTTFTATRLPLRLPGSTDPKALHQVPNPREETEAAACEDGGEEAAAAWEDEASTLVVEREEVAALVCEDGGEEAVAAWEDEASTCTGELQRVSGELQRSKALHLVADESEALHNAAHITPMGEDGGCGSGGAGWGRGRKGWCGSVGSQRTEEMVVVRLRGGGNGWQSSVDWGEESGGAVEEERRGGCFGCSWARGGGGGGD